MKAPTSAPTPDAKRTLVVYCAAVLKAPIEALADEFAAARPVTFQFQFGGSGTLLSQLRIDPRADLYLPAEASYLDEPAAMELVAERRPIAGLIACIAVARDNPRQIRSLDDLLRADVRLGLPLPQTAAIGRVMRDALAAEGLWDRLLAKSLVTKPTVNALANDVVVGAIDAALTWTATVRQYPQLGEVRDGRISNATHAVDGAVLRGAVQGASAREFLAYIADPAQHAHFERAGFAPAPAAPESPAASEPGP